MIIRAMTDFPVDRERSFLIGDKQSDLDAATAAGMRGFMFAGGNLSSFAEWALADMDQSR
jgi:D-glycero-D-manno-heptose 1,7-bisphosphate phosphatase